MFNHVDKIRLVACDRSELEGTAVSQLVGTAGMEGIEVAAGMPDLHPGKSGPVGAAFLAEKVIYPHLIGNDIGCGMALSATSLNARKVKLDRWEKNLRGLDAPWSGDCGEWLERFSAPVDVEHGSLGTVGGGNHFAELQAIERVEDDAALSALGLDERELVLLVHSGSRGLGEAIFRAQLMTFGHVGHASSAGSAGEYLDAHAGALAWAKANRALIARRFTEALGAECRGVIDAPHNFIAQKECGARGTWLHRKGANASDAGAVVIPGSRGAFSYLVLPTGADAENLHSLPHGAGRKWARGDCKARLYDRYAPETLLRTGLGSRVICDDRSLLYEEAPQAYKDIDAIIRKLVEAKLVTVVAKLRPMITYKFRKEER